MRYYKKILLSVMLMLTLAPLRTAAQFVLGSDDPARLRWMQAEWPHYRVVFPEGLDSLANVYGNLLEKYRIPVSRSTGMVAGGGYRRKTHVILHAYDGVSNAMVAWSPKRMDFHTLGMPYETEALPWEKNLAIHESRHLSQMMLGYEGMFRPLKWITGDMLPVAATGLWTPSYLLEGDAVVAETALTDLGRGRDGDFLNYYHSAFDAGDYRSWNAWKYGSWRRYAPNHYALGYLTIAGTRVFYDDPMFMDNIYSRLYTPGGLKFGQTGINSVRREIRLASGMKFRDAWSGIVDGFRQTWEDAAQLRGPFIKDEFVTQVPTWFEAYGHGTFAHGQYYAVRNGLLRPSRLVRVDADGSVTDIRSFSGSSSDLSYDPVLDRIYWSETFTHPRWGNGATSRIRYFDLSETDGSKGRSFKPHDLTREGRLYNPVASHDGKYVCAVDYKYLGGYDLVVVNAATGEISSRHPAPSGIQLTMPAWFEDGIAVIGLSDEGMGIYKVADGKYSVLLAPAKTKIGGLTDHDGGLLFTSDRTGVNEAYFYHDGDVIQLTSTRYGASDAKINGDTVYYLTEQTGIPVLRRNGKPRPVRSSGEGILLHRAATSDLLNRKVDFGNVAGDAVADVLSSQEEALEHGTMIPAFGPSDWTDMTPQVRKYNKLIHIPRFHSWAPLSVQYDDFAALNFDSVLETAGIGGTAWFQNDLGTASGYVSYGYNLSPVREPGAWLNRHSGHMKFLYTGLFPAFEFETHVGDRPAFNYSRVRKTMDDRSVGGLSNAYADYASFNASLRVYVPLKFNSGGWYRGLTPSVSYIFTNDQYRKSPVLLDYGTTLEGDFPYHGTFQGISDTKATYMQTLSASVTGYVMQPTPSSLMYPKLGLGVQMGYHQRIGLGDIYSAGAYGYLYGYVPGFFKTHGMKLTALVQHTFDATYVENVVNLFPRGFVESDLGAALGTITGTQAKLTADYAMQFALPQRQFLSGLMHFTHMSVIPHADLLLFPYMGKDTDMIRPEMIYSVGATVAAHAANVLWFPAGCQIGLSFDYNGGPSFDHLTRDGIELSRFHLGLVFNVDI